MGLTPAAKSSLKAIAAALTLPEDEEIPSAGETVADFLNRLIAEPDKKKRRQMMKDYSERHKDAAKFIRENEDLINAEAEKALIASAVGSTHIEKEISYKGGKKVVSRKEKHIAPNAQAAEFLLKNRMPEKYSDKPAGDIEVEDVSEIEEELYGEDTPQKDNSV